jgi:hypothetical protein
MTMTLDRPTVEAPPAGVTWGVHPTGVWLAHRDGRFAGLVQPRWGSGFTVSTALGKDLGLHPTLEAAQAALEHHLAA